MTMPVVNTGEVWMIDFGIRDKSGRILGHFETDTCATREASGKIIGRGSNQLLRLLK